MGIQPPFPGSDALREGERLVVAPRVGKIAARHITLTPPVFNSATAAIFLVCGTAKAATLTEVLVGDY